MSSPDPLLTVLREPGRMTLLSTAEWDRLLRMARAHRLLAKLGELARGEGIECRLPHRALDNIRAAQVWVDHFQLRIRRELREVRRAIGSPIPLVLLKGAAYMMAGLPPAAGRSFADLDLLVRFEDLQTVEQAMLETGWHSQVENEYDQRYYRQWMHEIPPLVHPLRGVEVDVHHNLLPSVGRFRPAAKALWERATPLESNGLFVLSPEDMVLHSAVHLVVSDELRGGLRDLFDIHQLYCHFFRRDRGFPAVLLERARSLGLAKPLFYVLQASHELLHTPYEAELLDYRNFGLRNPFQRVLMCHLVKEVLRPRPPEAAPPSFRRWLLYVRSHWIRMPPGLLLGHLTRKSVRRIRERVEEKGGGIP